jgi:hypothetical protein
MLAEKPDIIVTTPSRVLPHLKNKVSVHRTYIDDYIVVANVSSASGSIANPRNASD